MADRGDGAENWWPEILTLDSGVAVGLLLVLVNVSSFLSPPHLLRSDDVGQRSQ